MTQTSPGVTAAINAIRDRMASKKCNWDKAYLSIQAQLKRMNRVGVRSEWTIAKDDFDEAYRILAKEAK